MDRSKLSLNFSQTRKATRPDVLEFQPKRVPPTAQKIELKNSSSLLNSSTIFSTPEIKSNFINMASPDRFFLPITPIKTPVYLSNHTLSESDQEAYMKGFVDALMELQKQKLWTTPLVTLTPMSPYKSTFEGHEPNPFLHPPSSSISLSSNSNTCDSSAPINLSTSQRRSSPSPNECPSPPKVAAFSLLTPPEEEKIFPHSSVLQNVQQVNSSSQAQLKKAQPQQVLGSFSKNVENIETYSISPSSSSLPSPTSPKSSPPSTSLGPNPIDDKQEKEFAKLARRREKNRNAARKCRTKKLERIAQLEVKVKSLKDENNQLSNILGEKKLEVLKLKQNLALHISNNNCHLYINPPSLSLLPSSSSNSTSITSTSSVIS